MSLRLRYFQPEQAKTVSEQGKYVDPQAYGKSAAGSIMKTPPAPSSPRLPGRGRRSRCQLLPGITPKKQS